MTATTSRVEPILPKRIIRTEWQHHDAAAFMEAYSEGIRAYSRMADTAIIEAFNARAAIVDDPTVGMTGKAKASGWMLGARRLDNANVRAAMLDTLDYIAVSRPGISRVSAHMAQLENLLAQAARNHDAFAINEIQGELLAYGRYLRNLESSSYQERQLFHQHQDKELNKLLAI